MTIQTSTPVQALGSVLAQGGTNARTIGSPQAQRDQTSLAQSEPAESATETSPFEQGEVEVHRLELAVQEVAAKLPVGANQLEFSVDEESGKTIIRVIDPQTDEVIRQLPPDEVLELAEALDDLGGSTRGAAGLLIDGEA